MVIRLTQIYAFLSRIHTNEKLKKRVFNHYYQHHTIKYVPAIASINRKKSKHYSNFAPSPPLISALIVCSYPERQWRSVCSTAQELCKEFLHHHILRNILSTYISVINVKYVRNILHFDNIVQKFWLAHYFREQVAQWEVLVGNDMSLQIEVARFRFKRFQSLSNLTVTSAAMLPRYL